MDGRRIPAPRGAAVVMVAVGAFAAGLHLGGGPTVLSSARAEDQKGAAEALRHLLQSAPARAVDRPPTDYGLGDSHISKLRPYPPGGPGVRTPFDLWRYGGRGESSWKSPT